MEKADIDACWFLWYTILWSTDWCTKLLQIPHYPCVLSKILGFLWLRIVKNGKKKADIDACWFLWYTIVWSTDWWTKLLQIPHYPCVLSKILGFL